MFLYQIRYLNLHLILEYHQVQDPRHLVMHKMDLNCESLVYFSRYIMVMIKYSGGITVHFEPCIFYTISSSDQDTAVQQPLT